LYINKILVTLKIGEFIVFIKI